MTSSSDTVGQYPAGLCNWLLLETERDVSSTEALGRCPSTQRKHVAPLA